MKNTIKIFAAIRRIAAMRGIAIIALVAVIGFSMAACDTDPGSASSLTITNNGNVAIYYVYVSPSGSTSWGSDLLAGNGETISVNASKTFQLSSGVYDVRVRDAQSTDYYKWAYPVDGNATLYFVGGSSNSELGTVNISAGSLPAPTGLTAVAYSSSDVQLYWNAVPGATSYKVYNGVNSSSIDNSLGSSSTNMAVNNNIQQQPGTTIYYQVAAVRANGTEGPRSNVASATTLGAAAGYSIDGLWVGDFVIYTISGNSGVFTAIPSTNPLYTDALNKRYISIGGQSMRNLTGSGSSWSGQRRTVTYNSGNPYVAIGSDWNNCTITMDSDGETLYISTPAATGEGQSITLTRWGSAGTGSAAPSAPTGLSTTNSSGSMLSVSWSAVSGAAGYIVYISADDFRTYTSAPVSSSATSYTQTGMPAGTYKIMVSAYNADGTEGAKSTVTTVTITGSGGTPGVLPAPTGLTATGTSTTTIGLTWNAVPGAAKYNIYRSTNYGTGFTSSEWPNTSASHTNLTPNTTWYYKVAAVNASGREGEMSNTVSATTQSGGSPNATWDKLIFGTGATSSDTANNVKAASTSISGEVIIPSINKNGTARITSIIQNGFSGCTDVTSIELPETLTTINSGAFNGCTGITSITIPASVTSIQGTAFNNCNNLTSVTFLGAAASISSTANTFPGDLRLKYMAGGAGTYTRTAGSDTWATEGGSILDILTPSGTSGNQNVKAANSSISGNIVIPEYIGNARITSIANAGFQGCTGITGVTLPNSITAINANAFSGCTGITSITIPATVTTIGGTAFNNCTSLTSVTFMGDTINSFSSTANTFPGDLRAVFTGAGGGHGTYTRTSGGTNWTKQ